jgi:hypothetical protein
MMDTKQILADLRAELNRIEQAIAALEGLDGTGTLKATALSAQPAPAKARGRRTMSPAARKKIAEAQRKRWAAQKKAAARKPAKKVAAGKALAKKAKRGSSGAGMMDLLKSVFQ